MNFQDLYKKIKSIDETGSMPAQSNAETPLMGEEDIEECGGMPSMGPMSSMSSKQQDNVTMNVSMNGSGAGGIRDLMAILKNIEQGSDDSETDMVVGLEQYANSPNEQTAGVDAVTPTGDDLHSKGSEAEKVNGGGNPMQKGVSESLLTQLTSLYTEVKLR
jgi:hypothetical protein